MSRIIKIFSWSLAILFIFILVAGGYLYSQIHTATTGTIQLTGLKGPVTITRDKQGIPHIIAQQSDEDAFFALGYVHAQDRFWQMEVERRIAQGTLSEIIGPETLSIDQFARTMGFYRLAQDDLKHLDAKTKSLIHSYTQGVNAFLQQKKYPLQILLLRYEPKPWTEVDSIVWAKLMAWDLQTSWQREIDNYLVAQKFGSQEIPKIFLAYPKNAPTIVNEEELKQSKISSHAYYNLYEPNLSAEFLSLENQLIHMEQQIGFEDFPSKGSNNWVVSGRLTKTGKPMLANDPHLELQAPMLWYLVELKGPTIHVTGATIPGFPAIVIGHNDQIAWGVTNMDTDTQDLYIESTEKTFQTRNEIIKVKGKPDIHFSIQLSQHGPIVNNILSRTNLFSRPIAFQWTALQPNDTSSESFIKLDYARNWSEFVDALSELVVPSQNFIYADVKDNIGYTATGKIPIRKNWVGVLPVVDDGKHEWQGFVPFSELPHVYNPKKGYIATANNKAAPDSYPYTLTFRWYTPPYRIERIVQLIHQHHPITLNDNIMIQNDVKSMLWSDLRSTLLATQPINTRDQQALNILKTWDGEITKDSIAGTIFIDWFSQISAALEEQLPFEFNHYKNPAPLFIENALKNESSFCHTKSYQNCKDLLNKTLDQAINDLTKKFNNSDMNTWQWGKIHQARFEELIFGHVKYLSWLWDRKVSVAGSSFTVNANAFEPDTLECLHGPGYRQIIDLSNFNQSLYIEAMGQSENPWSQHYQDLLPRWANGLYVHIVDNQFLDNPLILKPIDN